MLQYLLRVYYSQSRLCGDKIYKPINLFMLVLNKLKQIKYNAHVQYHLLVMLVWI